MTADFKGICLRIGATAFFTFMVLFVKLLAEDLPVGQTVFYRSAFALIPLVIFLFITGDFPSGLKTKRPSGHIARCAFGCIAMFTSFASLKYLPIADATIIGYLAPILTVLLARLILGEAVTKARWVGVIFGFAGMLVLILPQLNSFDVDRNYLIGVGLGFVTAGFTAIAKIQIRSLALTENAGAIAFYFALTCTVAGLATLPLGWPTPDNTQLALLIGSGITGGIAHIMMTLSYQYSEASKLATFEYLSLIFAVFSDLFFFNIIPGISFYIAASCILFATIFVALKDKSPSKVAATRC
ncbi:DMT family transporter [Kiloniella antarctica]|uniref:DMT family transporter n=1 Tax=Kiloniella antarctica TaxID=1550907 RepID=A0ABW5BIV6_9PROT